MESLCISAQYLLKSGFFSLKYLRPMHQSGESHLQQLFQRLYCITVVRVQLFWHKVEETFKRLNMIDCIL